jgi:HEAT repeat protein
MGARTTLIALCFLCVAGALASAQDMQPPVTPASIKAAIDQLGNLDYNTRTGASRTVRRAAADIAVPALIDAVNGHKDGYVRFRALVLLSGFNDPRTKPVALAHLVDPNDRVRATAYAYFETHPAPDAVPIMLKALEHEESEFVRPSLTRALAVSGDDARVRDTMKMLVNRGEDFFRAEVIEALGDYKAAYAFPEIAKAAQNEGPLQDDAVLALGKIGDKRAMEVFAELQRTAPRNVQPSIAAGICLLGVNCAAHLGYLGETLRFGIKNPGFQELLRTAVAGLGALAARENPDALQLLWDEGIPSQDPARAPIALALGTVAVRNPPFMVASLEKQQNLDGAVGLLREAFDMLEEDYAKEQFFVAVRKMYWGAAQGSPMRRVAGVLIQKLDF